MKQKKTTILFIDSGFGGISILEYYRKKFQDSVSVLYFADTLNYPYGLKSEELLGEILYDNVLLVQKIYNIAMIVIACNTASVSALEFLRQRVKVPVIGTVPAVKPASLNTLNNKIGIIATETTTKGDYLANLIHQFAHDKEVYIKPSTLLVDIVENGAKYPDRNEMIKNELQFFIDKKIDSLVLGCTHYSFLKDEIKAWFSDGIEIFDSCEGVSKRIHHMINKEKLKPETADTFLYISKQTDEINRVYTDYNKQTELFNQILSKDFFCQKV